MIGESEYVEWNEPPRSPENRYFYVTYQQFIRLVFGMLRKLLPLVAGSVVILFLVFSITKHQAPMRMTLSVATFFAMMLLTALLVCHVGYIFSLRVQRHVRLSASDVSYVTLSKKGSHSFTDITRVTIEFANAGCHRLVMEGARGELCRLRVPSGFDVNSIVRLIPPGKLERRDLKL